MCNFFWGRASFTKILIWTDKTIPVGIWTFFGNSDGDWVSEEFELLISTECDCSPSVIEINSY